MKLSLKSIVKGIGKVAKSIGLPTTLKDLVKTAGIGLLTGGLAPTLGLSVPSWLSGAAKKTGITKLLQKTGLDKLAQNIAKAGLFDWGNIITGGQSGGGTQQNALQNLLQLYSGSMSGGVDLSPILGQLLQPPQINWTPLIGMGLLSAYLSRPYLQTQQNTLNQMLDAISQFQNILGSIAMPQAQQTAGMQNQLLNLLAGRLPRG